ncbi:hypothetical protein GCM10028778_04330 [Barrientosiimonas marina]|uniref:DUF4352 domain-containing protein n=1 Tax=Lentibacillus kimchii TaxID=1542911 RepID=A0ABW2US09_9BACI
MRKSIVLLLVGLLALVLSACGEDDSEAKKVDSDNDAEQQEDSDDNNGEEEEQKEFSAGDNIEKDGVITTVTNVERSNGTEFEDPDDGNDFAIVNIKIENESDDEVSYNPFDYSLKNSKGQIKDSGMSMVDQDNQLDSGKLVPDGKVEGSVVFQAPEDDDNGDLTLLIEDDWLSEDKIKVNLGE